MSSSFKHITAPPHEQQLLQQVVQGNEDAFTVLYRHYSGAVYEAVMAYVHDQSDSRETVQDVFIRLWDKREHLVNVQQFKDYLFIITRNCVFDQFKKKAAVEKFRKRLINHFHLSDNATEQKVLESHCRLMLQQAVNQLPPARKKVFQLRQAGFTYEEIAARLHVSRFTVKNQVKAALDFIRSYVTVHWYSCLILSLACVY
jgi:RNA polymerase sigma-70 factor (family 1)